MASSKIFAGSRLRRLRAKQGLTQLAFAQSLGISASYLNLMERDQRPLTAQVILKLSTMDGVDVTELAASEAAHALLPQLREMLADPLLQGEVPPGGELNEALQVAPNFSAAGLKLYAAYREALRKLASAAQGLPTVTSPQTATEWLNERDNDDLEGLAEEIWSELSPKDDIFAGIKARLRSAFGVDVRVRPETIMGQDRSRYDRHSQRLMISEALGFETRLEEAAHLLARLEGKALIDEAVLKSPFNGNPEAERQAKAAMKDYLCLALRLPRALFRTSAEDLRFDIERLARRFSVPYSDVMLRIALLQDNAAYLALNASGQMASRFGQLKIFIAADAPPCTQLPLFDAGTGLHMAEMKPAEGSTLIAIASRQDGNPTSLLITPEFFGKTIYAAKLEQRPWGPACRLCEIRNCTRRIAAAVTRPTGLNDYIRGPTDFEPV
ncbi:helix-turn-helix transcriptional regulator [Aestuariivirga litoralis]|uniref:helix-turn-helix transcriptional regulator n=1 Tax=Aestuariivirga litoralis TaxID=2650924 RepID=UPI0018C5D32E|nr:helix-turn-helix transcriptional regulator [Aestuariivirga litoralis]MBG1232830.1 helix-turn-helix domain-containing protein [Aestuariivirga litoralis]